jgi:hypothetical protein
MIDNPADAARSAIGRILAQQTAETEYHLFDRMRIRQAKQDRIRMDNERARRVDDMRTMLRQRVGLGAAPVPNPNGVAGLQQAPNHRRAHQAGATKSEFHCFRFSFDEDSMRLVHASHVGYRT